MREAESLKSKDGRGSEVFRQHFLISSHLMMYNNPSLLFTFSLGSAKNENVYFFVCLGLAHDGTEENIFTISPAKYYFY